MAHMSLANKSIAGSCFVLYNSRKSCPTKGMLCGAPLTAAVQHLASAGSSMLKSLGCSNTTVLLRGVSQLTHMLC